ncbi:hypothetical protein [Gordonia sp. SND2]|uniref:hypothetical protein n=1 Tax=Gordonia sp. SND2 TaxID=3388659 RepID=UPI00398B943E
MNTLETGEWITVHRDDPLGPAVLRKLQHDIGFTTGGHVGPKLVPVPEGGVRIREHADGSIDIEADVWLPGLPIVGDTIPTRRRPYRGLLKAASSGR